MSAVKTYPDSEGAVRNWLRTTASVVAIAGTRSFFGIPPKTDYPLTVVQQVGGGPEIPDAPISRELIQIDCWGADHREKATAANLKTAVINEIESLIPGTQIDTDAVCLGAHVLSALWRPDPATAQSRYVITALFVMRAA